MVGPEGDLTHAEKEFLKEKNVVFCRLTPTVIRSKDALMIGLGVLRSLFNEF
jgi:RsmE family RNA methyltransferase